MSDLLSDFLNDRIKPSSVRGVVNGIMDYGPPDDHYVDSDGSVSEHDEQEFIRSEIDTYFSDKKVRLIWTDEMNLCYCCKRSRKSLSLKFVFL